MFPLYLQYLLIDFRQTFVTGASCDTDDLITFLGQKVKVQGHTIAAEAHRLFLVGILEGNRAGSGLELKLLKRAGSSEWAIPNV